MPTPLTGIIPPLVTPLLGRDQLDLEGLERLVERSLAAGVRGLFILGSTGEGPSLSYRLRRELIAQTCQRVARRIPVLVGIADSAMVESLALARCAAEAGADIVVAAPPYYLPAGQPELLGYLERLVVELPLPLMLYNIPSLTKVPYEVATVAAAIQNPGIVGIKDSSGDMSYVHRLLRLARQRDDFSVLIGAEDQLAEAVLLGAHGGVPGGANLCPRLYVELYAAAAAGDLPRVRELQACVLGLGESLYTVGPHPCSWIQGLKCALALQGICADVMAEPLRSFEDPERAVVRQRLAALGREWF